MPRAMCISTGQLARKPLGDKERATTTGLRLGLVVKRVTARRARAWSTAVVMVGHTQEHSYVAVYPGAFRVIRQTIAKALKKEALGANVARRPRGLDKVGARLCAPRDCDRLQDRITQLGWPVGQSGEQAGRSSGRGPSTEDSGSWRAETGGEDKRSRTAS